MRAMSTLLARGRPPTSRCCILFRGKHNPLAVESFSCVFLLGARTSSRRALRLVAGARKSGSVKKRPWWRKFFSDDDDESWFGWSAEDVLGFSGGGGVDGDEDGVEEHASEEEKFEAWKSRAEAIVELREAQDDARNAEGRAWEDWVGGEDDGQASSWEQDWGGAAEPSAGAMRDDTQEVIGERGLVGAFKDTMDGDDDDELLFEDRVFRYASINSAKFIALLVLIPWALDFMVHDYLLMPFLDRYVNTVPLAAEILDVRRPQKFEMIKALKVEKARLKLEVEIGKSPPLSDEEIWSELQHKAIELRDEWRLENRRAFANIWSDMVYGVTLFILIYLNKSQVALLKFTGYKLLNNISDTGKAFLIILITDIFLGYHSESGWQALMEIIIEHYGFEIDQAIITIFICSFPVVVDACVKLWVVPKCLKYIPGNATSLAELSGGPDPVFHVSTKFSIWHILRSSSKPRIWASLWFQKMQRFYDVPRAS